MAKKIVRGITDIKTINNQDLDTNNVNDLLSDGKHNYIHRKKEDGSEEYHNLTNNIKTLETVENGLLTVTNYNNTTNSAELEVHHDQAKSQLLGSPNQTINVQNGENGSAELTTVDVNPEKVLEHDNLLTGDSLNVIKSGNISTISLETTEKPSGTVLSSLETSVVFGVGFPDSPEPHINLQGNYVTLKVSDDKKVQFFIRESSATSGLIIMSYRFVTNGVATAWRETTFDSIKLTSLLNDKQNTITNNTSIGVSGTGLQQLYTNKETYTHENGTLITYSKSIANSTSISTADEEFHLFVRLNKGTTTASFTLNEHDTAVFNYIMSEHGINNEFNINNSIFKLTGSTLEYLNNSTGVTFNNFITTFTYLIPSNPSPENVTVEKVDEIADKTVVTEKEETE